jgi:uncharacterized Zn-binding protein involved in type VI secretion
MPGPLLHAGALLNCFHAGPVTVVPKNTRVLVSGRPVLTVADPITVTGCPFTVGTKYQPCVIVRAEAATKVLINGQPAVVLTPSTLGYSAEQAPQGPPNLSATQTRVIAS